MNQSLDRALRLLDLLGDGPKRLGPLADELAIHKSSVLRLLQTFEAHRLVRRIGDPPEFALGFHLVELSQSLLENIDMRDVAAEPLKRLGEQTGETIHLAVLDGADVVYLEKVESVHPVRMYSKVGARAPAYCTGVGKVILAFIDERQWPQLELRRHTPHTITTEGDLRTAMKEIRSQGWGYDEREHEDAIRCIAAPIFASGRSDAVAAISVSALVSRFSREQLNEYVDVLLSTATAITQGLGGRPHELWLKRSGDVAGERR